VAQGQQPIHLGIGAERVSATTTCMTSRPVAS
jgi:hypothetical protein